MAQFILIRGPKNSGKTYIAWLVYRMLSKMATKGTVHLFRLKRKKNYDKAIAPAIPSEAIEAMKGNNSKDFLAILEIGGVKIGIASAGDSEEIVKDAVAELLQYQVDIIVCCTHSRDMKGSAYRWLKENYFQNHSIKEFEVSRSAATELVWQQEKQTIAEKVVQYILGLCNMGIVKP